MTEPTASRPHMPGYGILDADRGKGLLPWSWAKERLTGRTPIGLLRPGRRIATRYACVGRVAGRQILLQHRKPVEKGAQPERGSAMRYYLRIGSGPTHRGRRRRVNRWRKR